MIIILGDFDLESKKMIIIILSKKNYKNFNIIINNSNYKTIQIKKYKIIRICLKLHDFDVSNINIVFKDNLNIIDKISNLNLTSAMNNVEVLGCDSTYGLEKNLWDKLSDIESHFLIHCGDQIYNDNLFKKYYRKENLNKRELQNLELELFDNYYSQFNRYKNVLKNNFNLMIPDDHEVVDNSFESAHKDEEKFIQIKKIFVEYYTKIQLNLRLNNNDIYYKKDNSNGTIYALNYLNEIDNNLLLKYDFDSNIQNYSNVVIISRKSLLSYKINKLNQLVYSEKPFVLNNIDFLLSKFIANDKNLIILCGDDHAYKESKIMLNDRHICKIITCGAINTVPEIIKDEIILSTDISNLSIENKYYELANSFVKISYTDNKLKLKKIIKKTDNLLLKIYDNIKSVIKFL